MIVAVIGDYMVIYSGDLGHYIVVRRRGVREIAVVGIGH
jgi:hypothetical protein